MYTAKQKQSACGGIFSDSLSRIFLNKIYMGHYNGGKSYTGVWLL